MDANTNTIEVVHVTAIRNGSVYGHSVDHCDECSCSGNEMYLGVAQDHVEVGGTYDVDDWCPLHD